MSHRDKRLSKNLRHQRNLRDLNNMWFQPLDHIGRFPLTQRNPMKKIDEKNKKRVNHVFMTHPLFILPPGIRCAACRGIR